MGQLVLLDPTGVVTSAGRSLAPRPASLAGKVVGLRTDPAWHSFGVFADRIEQLLRARCGVRDVVRFAPGRRVGAEGVATAAALKDFVAHVEVAVVGLGT
jgi:hypothetical protein